MALPVEDALRFPPSNREAGRVRTSPALQGSVRESFKWKDPAKSNRFSLIGSTRLYWTALR
jgi:hypothetical protein